jgi:adenylate kinase
MPSNKQTIYSFIGLPASGKGTQASILAEKEGIKVIGMGDLIRSAINGDVNDPFVAEIKNRYDKGIPQPDSVAIDLVKKYLGSVDRGIIFDNFPFTAAQATFLEEFIKDNSEWDHKVIYINLDPETAIKRVISRKICSECGTIYGATDDMICEKCGGSLIVRADDNEETVRTRIGHYMPKIREVIDFYADKNIPIIEVDGEKSIEDVTKEISSKL